MKTSKLLIIIIGIFLISCQTATVPTPTKIILTPKFLPTPTTSSVATIALTSPPSLTPNLGEWNGLQYDTRKWRVITYNESEWTPETYPAHTLVPVLTHNFIEGCFIYLEEGRDMPGMEIKEIPVIIGGRVIFDERMFSDVNGPELFMVILGTYHVDFPKNNDKSACIKDAERTAMTAMQGNCPSGNCGSCPGLPPTILKVGTLVKAVNPQMDLPVTEPGGDQAAGNKSDWYFSDKDFTSEQLMQFQDYTIEVIDGPVCVNDNAWWQLRSPNGILGWDSDDHFVMQP